MKKALESFLLSKEAEGRARRTLETYEQRIGWVTAFLAERGIHQVGEVRAGDLDGYIVSMRRRGLSVATVVGCVQAIKTFFRWCVERGLLSQSPAAHLRKQRLPRGGRSKAMARDDLLALIEEAERRADAGRPRDLAILLLLADTGARVGEVVGLELGDLALDECTARIDGKSGPRSIDFTERTAVAMQAWLSVRPDVDHQFLFLAQGGRGAKGAPLGAEGVRRVLRRLAGKAGIESSCNPHSIRHLTGQSWIDQGANLELVRLKLGHRDIETTARFYSHQDRSREKQATKKYSLVSSPARPALVLVSDQWGKKRVRRGAAKIAR